MIASTIWAWAIQNWIPLLGGLLVVVWVVLEVVRHHQETVGKPSGHDIKFPKGEVRQGPPPTRDVSVVEPAESDPVTELQTEIIFSAPDDAELEVIIVSEEFHPFEFRAIFLEAKIVIRNRTAKTKYLSFTRFSIDGPEDGQPRYQTIEVRQALEALEKKRPKLQSTIDPDATITGWVHVALPHQISGGVGGFAIEFRDEIGTEYVLRREPRGGAKSTVDKKELILGYRNSMSAIRDRLHQYINEGRLMKDMTDGLESLVRTQHQMLTDFEAYGIGGLGDALSEEITMENIIDVQRTVFATRLDSMVDALDTLLGHTE